MQRRKDRKRKREEDEIRRADEEATARQAKKAAASEADSPAPAVKKDEEVPPAAPDALPAESKVEIPKAAAAPEDTEMKDAPIEEEVCPSATFQQSSLHATRCFVLPILP